MFPIYFIKTKIIILGFKAFEKQKEERCLWLLKTHSFVSH